LSRAADILDAADKLREVSQDVRTAAQNVDAIRAAAEIAEGELRGARERYMAARSALLTAAEREGA
jgi:hypothetical protein